MWSLTLVYYFQAYLVMLDLRTNKEFDVTVLLFSPIWSLTLVYFFQAYLVMLDLRTNKECDVTALLFSPIWSLTLVYYFQAYLVMLDLRTNKECDVPALLASAVVQLCREKIVFRHHLCIFGNITVLVDDQPVVAFFSKDIHAPQKGTALAFLFTRGWYRWTWIWRTIVRRIFAYDGRYAWSQSDAYQVLVIYIRRILHMTHQFSWSHWVRHIQVHLYYEICPLTPKKLPLGGENLPLG